MEEKNSDVICTTDGDFFESLFEMEERIVAEVDAKLEREKKEKEESE